MLCIFSGLPGTGKTELSLYLARELGAVHVRIDSIEQALRDGGITDVGPVGYVAGYRVAADQLQLGLSVVADSVNPLDITRAAWRQVARDAGVAWRDIEVICSDLSEHRRRVEERESRIPGLRLPTWADVMAREYHDWDGEGGVSDRVVIDTAGQTPAESKRELMRLLHL